MVMFWANTEEVYFSLSLLRASLTLELLSRSSRPTHSAFTYSPLRHFTVPKTHSVSSEGYMHSGVTENVPSFAENPLFYILTNLKVHQPSYCIRCVYIRQVAVLTIYFLLFI